MRRETIDMQGVGVRRETIDASEARRETRDVRRGSSLSSCNLVSRLTSHAPTPWPKVRLGDVCEIRTGKRDVNFGSADGKYPFFTCAKEVSRCNSYSYDFDAILLAGNCDIGNMFRFKGKFEAYQRTYILTNKRSDIADIDYVWDCLRDSWVKITRGKMLGAAVQYIKLGMIKEFQIPLPPLPVQRRIADVLSAYDDLIENNRRRIAILEETARLAYRKWFGGSGAKGGMRHETIDEPEVGRETRDVRRVSSLPSHVRVSRLTSHAQLRTVTLGEICREVRRGVNPDAIAPDTPYIGLEHMPRRSISLYEWESAQKITSTKLAFETGDILFGKIRPYFHKVGIAFVDGVASSDAIVIKPNRPELLAYVLMTVSSDAFVAAASQGMKEGSKMPRADWKQLLRYCVVLPDAETLSAFNKVLNPILAQLKALCFSTRTLASARDMLLPRLMKGGAT